MTDKNKAAAAVGGPIPDEVKNVATEDGAAPTTAVKEQSRSIRFAARDGGEGNTRVWPLNQGWGSDSFVILSKDDYAKFVQFSELFGFRIDVLGQEDEATE